MRKQWRHALNESDLMWRERGGHCGLLKPWISQE